MAVIEPSRSLRWRCAVCGAGRIPGVAASTLGAGTKAKLVAVQRGRAIELGAGIGALVLAASAVMVGLVAAFAFALHATVTGVVLAGLGVVAALVALRLRGASRKNGAAWRSALDDAWTDGAEIIARGQGGTLTAPELATAMRISEGDAESLLSQLSVEGARVSVDDEAGLRYRIDALAASKPPAAVGAPEPDAEKKEQSR
jgi:hypothetical protein